jgi:hypothetical protein
MEVGTFHCPEKDALRREEEERLDWERCLFRRTGRKSHRGRLKLRFAIGATYTLPAQRRSPRPGIPA